jgi:ABC-2 type transport system ATP-binding protein
MDAIVRRQMWSLLREMKKKDITILLTTHYMEEAEALCDRVALINKGALKKIGVPKELIEDLGKYTVEEEEDTVLNCRHFKEKKDALDYLEKSANTASLRATTLEDVFVEAVG